jgi:hypothetical protein
MGRSVCNHAPTRRSGEVTTKPPRRQRSTHENSRLYLETLRPRLIDLEAVAHAAGQMLGELPYLKTADDQLRRNYARMQSLVSTTAAIARDVLNECEELVARAYEDAEIEDLDPGDDPDDPDDGPGGAAPGGVPPGDDSPGGSAPGNGSKLAACSALGIPMARGSRGGIALDVKPIPPVAR